MCFNCSQIPTVNECLNYHELNTCEYLKLKKIVHLFTHNSTNFLYQTVYYKVNLKGATKLYFMYYSRVVVILFSIGL